ncbi:MAG TPA: hypothetical protein VIQ30_11825 [Pseudonocardia sp.]
MTVHTTQLCPDDPVTERTHVKTTDPPNHELPGGTTTLTPAVRGPAVDSPSELLRRAAELIEQRGLFQHEWWPDALPAHGEQPRDYIDGDPCCAIGALAVAAGAWQVGSVHRALTNLPALAAANDALHAAMPPGVAFVAAWNDQPGRTAGEVAEVMRSAASRLDTNARPGGPSAKTFHRAGANHIPNHQDDSKEPLNV